MKRSLLLLAALLLAGSTASAQTLSREQIAEIVRQACETEFNTICAGIQPGNGRLLQCLRAHPNEVSPNCKNTLISLRNQAKNRM